MKEEIAFLKEHILKNSTVVVACSGGPDSMCLLSLINTIKKEQNIKIICAHVNHKIRKISDEEAKMVENYCKQNNIEFNLLEINEFKEGNFTENLARKKRYVFFDDLAKNNNAKYLLTAHHGDDLIETILMRITRGSTLSGYIGIRQISSNANYEILRPLLTTNKEQILDYVQEHGIPHALDKSNDSLEYTRNRYRHIVLPFLKKEDSNIETKYLKFSKELIEYEKFVNDYINNKKIVVDNSIEINKIINENLFIQRKSIELLIKNVQKKYEFEVSDTNMQEILDLLKNSNKSIDLKNGFIAINSYGNLKILKKNNNVFKTVQLDKNVQTELFNFYYNCTDGNSSNNCIYLLSDEIKLPLKLRSKTNGDKIFIKNMNGSKKISDVFIDSKIPSYERDIYPILVDSENTVLWIPGLKKSKFSKDKSEKYDIIIKCEAR